MTRTTTALPLSPTYAAALAHIADLRADAERHRLARAASRPRRGPAWPVPLVVALRRSLVGPVRRPAPRRGGDACVAC